MNERLILGKDGFISIKVPILSRRVLLDHSLMLEANLFPLSAALNAFLKILHAFDHITIKHVVLVYLVPASLDDLVADLC